MAYKVVHSCFIFCLLYKAAILPVAKPATSGPYKNFPVGFSKCKDPSMPYVKEIMVELYLAMRNTIIRGNYTVFKELRNYKSSIQDFYYEGDRRVLTFQVKRLTCHSRFQEYLIKAFGIKINNKTCVVPKGSYRFAVDYNKLDHLWTETREYGRTTRRIETYTKTATISCYEIDFDVRSKKETIHIN